MLPIKDLQAQASKPINTLTQGPKIRDRVSKRYTGNIAIMETKVRLKATVRRRGSRRRREAELESTCRETERESRGLARVRRDCKRELRKVDGNGG
jgi:hypothetical protein